ncbi:MAG: hypothetical protein RBT80_13595 [Candidatus Vecturithrix sp.]|jgi:hypothetical protein|nr:hypothetical protein [Candidatus Vecturithrix sp.]
MDDDQLKHLIRENDPLSRADHRNPYKFLDYYNPEDADIFFGRDRETRQLEQKFYNSCLLVLHGESGAGKTSLIRAGLMPRLSPEEFVPVYVRVLQEPLLAIQRELIHQLRLEADHRFQSGEVSDLQTSLAPATLHQRIKDFLGVLPNLADSPAQRAFVASIGLEHSLQQQLHVGLPQGQFVELLVSILSKYGRLADGRQALEALLEAAQQYVGQDRKRYCETLLHALRHLPQPTIPSQPAADHQSAHSLSELLRHVATQVNKTVVLELIDRAYETYRATVERSKTQARKQRRGLLLKVATALMAVALLVGGGFYQEALRQKKIAIAKQQEAEKQRKNAEAAKDKALRMQSLFLADLARQENEKQNYANGILLALEALPKTMATPERQYVPEAEAQLYAAVARLHERKVLRGHEERVWSAAFSPDGKRVVTASGDNTARVWEAASGQELTVLRGHEGEVVSAVFSPDGTRLVTASWDGTAKVWASSLPRRS